ncbi:MAG: type II secretion system protein [Planctomycetota bacterium]
MELLVVVAIISILAGLLLPALQEAVEAADRISCSSNQKQYLLALTVYANDFDALPHHRFSSNWAINDAGGNPYQYTIDGYNGGSGYWTGAQCVDVNGGYPYAKLLLDGRYADGYAGVACTSAFGNNDIGGTQQHGWTWSPRKPNLGNLPDGTSPQFVPFFSYNGPGANGYVGNTWSNPLALYDGFRVDNVRLTYGYRNSDPDRRVEGVWKLIDCPTNVQTMPGPVAHTYSPHNPFVQLGFANQTPNVVHYRNYGFNDGHVAGYQSLWGYP